MYDVYDHIVIGAGIGGLAAAALLQQRGRHVLLLEAHSGVGGCASYFARKKFLFDVGATTLSGMGHRQPVQRLLRELGIGIDMTLCDPGMTIRIGDATLQRWIDRDRWIAECERVFGPHRQREFWTLVHDTAAKAWNATADLAHLPVRSVADVLRLPSAVKHAGLLPSLFRSVADVLQELNLIEHRLFVRFLNEQLMITAQATIHDTPFIVGALGLAYPADTWYVHGGMNMLPRALAKNFTDNGGTLLLKKRVIEVGPEKLKFVRTDDGKVFYGRHVISNATGWDTGAITPSQEQYFRKEYDHLGGWGAFTAYIGMKDVAPPSAYQQIILEGPLPHCASESLFLSWSHPADATRAPEGYRTLTVSTHIPDPHQWWTIGPDASAQRKEKIAAAMMAVLDRAVPGFRDAEKPVVMFGTPITFANFTHRKFGQVGGIPHSMHRPLFFWPGPDTPDRSLSLVGDTVYPGQGAPGVILGALNLVDRLTR